jgi:hypothetical protein
MSFTDMLDVSAPSANASGHATVVAAAAQASRMVAGLNFTVMDLHAIALQDNPVPSVEARSDTFQKRHENRSRKPAYESRNSNALESHVLVYLLIYVRLGNPPSIPYKGYHTEYSACNILLRMCIIIRTF